LGNPNKLDTLDGLRTTVEKAKEKCIEKRWKYTRKNGGVVILRDVFDKIIKWIDKFKQVGDTVVQYDPVHIALPWAGIRFLLQVYIVILSRAKTKKKKIIRLQLMIIKSLEKQLKILGQ
jgi:hypothetical protein